MKKLIAIIYCFVFLTPINSSADEGMWLPMFIKGVTMEDMQKKGLKLTAQEIYSINSASLKDAIVSFNGYCTGEIISNKGLLLTNHHCGYDAIQNHSLGENDYLGEGYWAKDLASELPNEDMFVDFLISMRDVSSEVLDSIDYDTDEESRSKLINQRIESIKEKELDGTKYWAEIKSFFGGNEYYLFVYERFNDVRLVGAPPESIGKFGGDTDNWMWPRHTGDFALFRVYSAPDGSPAEYDEKNIPLVPKHFLPISLEGVSESDFTMVLGYPGGTDRYLSSFGVKHAIEKYNPTVVKIREEKLNILNKHMRADRSINIMYASKKARISNYWKYYIGQTRGLKRLRVYDQKKDLEEKFNIFAGSSKKNTEIYGDVVKALGAAQDSLEKTTLSRIYLNEAAWSGPSFVRLARRSGAMIRAINGGDEEAIIQAIEVFRSQANDSFQEYKKSIDKEIFVKMMEMYHVGVPENQLPKIIKDMAVKYDGDFQKWGDALYRRSVFVDHDKILALLDDFNPNFPDLTVSTIENDPGFLIQQSILGNYFQKIRPQNSKPQKKLDIASRLFIDGLRKMSPNKSFYPDANFTMRLTYGSVGSYSPGNAMYYDYETTLDGVMEKMDNDNPEFVVPQKLVDLYQKKDFGQYGSGGKMNVCFISNNDITGGNSGSPVINGNGHLVGCAFDGNWEAMSGDIAFEDNLQRTISVDVRYILFIIDKFAGASHIIDELSLVGAASSKKLGTRKKAPVLSGSGATKDLSNKGSFAIAFREAKRSKLGVFTWRGQLFTTDLEDK